MTLNGVMAVILRCSTEIGIIGANYVKVVEDRSTLSARKVWFKQSSFFAIYDLFSEISEKEFIRKKHPPVKAVS